MIYRVNKKFAWTETNVHRKLSANSSMCMAIQFAFYYIIEHKVDGKWKLAPNTSNHYSEEDAYDQIKLLYKYNK